MNIKERFKKTPSFRITLRYSLIAMFLLIIIALTLPKILNYGPNSINTKFDVQMSYISYSEQFIGIFLIIFFALAIFSHILLKDIDKWYILSDQEKYQDIKLIKKIRKKCFNLPYIVFLGEIVIPLILTTTMLFITGSHHKIMVFKILILIIAYLLLLAVISFIFSQKIYSEILAKTYSKDGNIGFRIPIWKKMFILILPIFIAGILIVSLIGYSRVVAEKENSYFDIYHRYLYSTFDSSKEYSLDDVISELDSIQLFNENHSKFIISNQNEIHTVSGPSVSNFVKEYTIQLSDFYNGRTYDSYGIDAQGSTIKLLTNEGTIYVGILFNVESQQSLIFFVFAFVISLFLFSSVLYLFGKSLSNDLCAVTTGFNNISLNTKNINESLPVITNDEIGDLIIAFNSIQELQKAYLNTIESNQSALMEQERLASLGQLIGGISHNLKTPIMSIAGASQGLSNLITEYDKSIGDSEVTNDDNHAIASDMMEWITKINSYTTYMSDIITAVKGQAVTLSESEQDDFTVGELIKRIQILMKNELQKGHVSLNINLNTLDNRKIKGNVNSLVQVINNLITNAIQSYRGVQGEINLSTTINGSSLNISVSDHGCGMPKDVQEKLFKEMITTKGKNGTGLGMFMSYSTIKGKFDGDITFTTKEGEGTTFNIILPLLVSSKK